MDRRRVPVRAKDRKRIVLTLDRERPVGPSPPFGQVPYVPAPGLEPRFVAGIYHSGMRLMPSSLRGQHRYLGLRFETSPSPSVAQIDQVRQTILANIGRYERPELPADSATNAGALPPIVLPESGRALRASAYPLQVTSATDGYLLGLTLTRPAAGEVPEKSLHRELISGAPWWRGERSASEHLTALETVRPLVAPESAVEFEAYYQAVGGISRERWYQATQALLTETGTFSEVLPPGKYVLALTTSLIFHGWDWANDATWKVTTEPYYSAAATPTPEIRLHASRATRCRVFLVPRRHHYTAQWIAVYVFVVLFWFTLTYSVNTMAFMDQLPPEPVPFSFTGAGDDTGINDIAVSDWIKKSNRYALALAQDRGLEFGAGLVARILIGREEGRWSVREGALHAGDLAAVVEVEYRGGTSRYYVWRRVGQSSTNTLLDFGRLITQEVRPYSYDNRPAYQVSVPYLPPL